MAKFWDEWSRRPTKADRTAEQARLPGLPSKRGGKSKPHKPERDGPARAEDAQDRADVIRLGLPPPPLNGSGGRAGPRGPRPTPGSGGGGRTGRGVSREGVFRVLNTAKHARATVNQARYIGRVDSHAERNARAGVPLENEAGEIVTDRDGIDAEIQSWNLKAADDNRSAAWRKATADERRDLEEQWRNATAEWRQKNWNKDPLRQTQTAHIIFSIPPASGDAEQLRAAVRAAGAEAFAGHRYVFAIHTDHGRGPHAHFVVQIDAIDATQQRLNLRKHALQRYRAAFVDHAREHGIDVVATRRQDRDKTRDQIHKGEQPLHDHEKRSKWTAADTLRGNVPGWYEQHGREYEYYRNGQEAPDDARPGKLRGFMNRFSKRHTPFAERTQELQTLAKYFAHYPEGEARSRAVESFVTMFKENPRTALWAFSNHGQAFGLADGNSPVLPGRIAAAAARSVDPSPRSTTEQQRQERDQQRERADRSRQTRRTQQDRDRMARSFSSMAADLAAAGEPDAAAQVAGLAAETAAGRPAPQHQPGSMGKPRQRPQRRPSRGIGMGFGITD